MMYKQCPRCKKKVKMSETCDCLIKDKRHKRNEYQKKYYKENKEDIKLIKNAKWSKLRKLIIKRDGGYCQRCFIKYKMFETDNLQVHHIKPRVDHPELVYDDKNLITVCRQCNLELGTTGVLDFGYDIPDLDYKI